jgi:phage shock protein E
MDQKEMMMAAQAVLRGARVLDVRTEAEFLNEGHLEQAENVPVNELPALLGMLGLSETEEIVVYCKSGGRSEKAKNYLLDLGYLKVFNGGGLSDMQRYIGK